MPYEFPAPAGAGNWVVRKPFKTPVPDVAVVVEICEMAPAPELTQMFPGVAFGVAEVLSAIMRIGLAPTVLEICIGATAAEAEAAAGN